MAYRKHSFELNWFEHFYLLICTRIRLFAIVYPVCKHQNMQEEK